MFRFIKALRKRAEPLVIRLRGDGSYDVEVKGESHYQNALQSIAGPKKREQASYGCDAEIIPEPSNTFDQDAIRVEIFGKTVGYIAREETWWLHRKIGAIERRNTRILAAAMIVGGWSNTHSEGSFSVLLDIDPDS